MSSKFTDLTTALADWFDSRTDELPDDILTLVGEAGLLQQHPFRDSPDSIWNLSKPDGRRQMAADWDRANDPERQVERDLAAVTGDEIVEILKQLQQSEQTLKRLETADAPVPAKIQKLKRIIGALNERFTFLMLRGPVQRSLARKDGEIRESAFELLNFRDASKSLGQRLGIGRRELCGYILDNRLTTYLDDGTPIPGIYFYGELMRSVAESGDSPDYLPMMSNICRFSQDCIDRFDPEDSATWGMKDFSNDSQFEKCHRYVEGQSMLNWLRGREPDPLGYLTARIDEGAFKVEVFPIGNCQPEIALRLFDRPSAENVCPGIRSALPVKRDTSVDWLTLGPQLYQYIRREEQADEEIRKWEGAEARSASEVETKENKLTELCHRQDQLQAEWQNLTERDWAAESPIDDLAECGSEPTVNRTKYIPKAGENLPPKFGEQPWHHSARNQGRAILKLNPKLPLLEVAEQINKAWSELAPVELQKPRDERLPVFRSGGKEVPDELTILRHALSGLKPKKS